MTDFVTLLHRTIKGSSALILLLVGIFDTYLSWLYSYKWLAYIGSGTFISGLFAMILVVFAIISFEYAVLSLKRNRNKVFIGFLFLFWFCLAFYSVQSTVASQYIDYTEAEYERTLEEQDKIQRSQRLELLNEQIERKKEQMSKIQQRISEYEKVLSSIEDIEKMGMWRTTVQQNEQRITSLVETFNSLEEELLQIEKKKETLLSEGLTSKDSAQKKNVFLFYEEIFKIEPNKIQFFLAIFKAVVLDLINILCFLFLTLEYVREKMPNNNNDRGPLLKEPYKEERKEKKEPLTYKQSIIAFIEETFKNQKDLRRRVVGYASLRRKHLISKQYYNRIINMLLSKGLIKKAYRCHTINKNRNKQDFYDVFFR